MSSQSFLEYVFEALESLAPDAGNHTLAMTNISTTLIDEIRARAEGSALRLVTTA